ncbi:MAG: MBOAT family protein [Clostridia bacterium]|nr:MBOAT family protein [Clostridia bacterium]
MVFSSTIFLCVFLPLVLLLYYAIPGKWSKNIILLVFSLVFYGWGEPRLVVLMVVSLIMNYLFGILMHHSHLRNKKGRVWLWLAVIFNIGLLFYFKYFTFTAESIAALTGADWVIKEIALPVGISFYTFQGMSYVIDVYREDVNVKPMVQKNPIKVALYIAMFPQLIAGPIVRYEDVLPYLDKRNHSFEKFAEGVEVFIIGLSKKVIFANILGEVATSLMETNAGMIGTAHAWFGAICYSLQIFYDFSGYSEMAIGLGKMFGFEFMQNFNFPYISRSITEFWRRWHISLSGWFRDYLYIPLGGNRRGNVYFNLFVVFLATGIWHGAAWGFIIWGLWHGAFMLIERILKKHPLPVKLPRFISSPLGWIYSMLVVIFGWVLFRIVDLGATFDYIKLMFGIGQPEYVRYGVMYYLNPRIITVLAAAIICCFPWKNYIRPRGAVFTFFKRVALIALLVICFMLITNSTFNPFIYYQF